MLMLEKRNGLYYPTSTADKWLMQHFANAEFEALDEAGLEKVRYIAAFHKLSVQVTDSASSPR